MTRADKTLDITGVRGTRAAAIAEGTLRDMVPGQVLKVISSDRQSKNELAALCERLGFVLHLLQEENGLLVVTIEKPSA